MRRFLIPSIVLFALLAQLPAQTKLPEAVQKSIKAHFPGAETEEVDAEKFGNLTRYEVELEIEKKGLVEREFEVVFTPNGTILEIESEVVMLPKAVKKAIDQQFHHAKMREADWVRRFSYEIEFGSKKDDEGEMEIHLSPEGRMIDDEGEIALDLEHLPPAVRSMVEARFGHHGIVEVEMTGAQQEAIYEIEAKVNGMEQEIAVTTSGNLVSVETEIAADHIPVEVRAALKKLGADHEIKKIELIERYVYEVEIQAPGHSLECLVCPSGRVLSAKVERNDDDAKKGSHGMKGKKKQSETQAKDAHGGHEHEHEDHDEDDGEDHDPEDHKDR